MQYSGRILKCVIEGSQVNEWSVFKDGLSRNIHQIDAVNGNIMVTDPSGNRILALDEHGNIVREVYPFGPLSSGKASPNYGHFNSVFCQDEHLYVVAHNYTQYSGKRSEILILDKETFEVKKVMKDIGGCAHNVIAREGYFLVCDSMDGLLKDQGNTVGKMGTFTRGLAMNDEYILVGGSMYGRRAERIGKDCFMYLLTHDFRPVVEITLEEIGPMFEVRFLGKDYGLSQG